MRLLVTGGAGFIGSNFINLYCDKFEKIIVLDKFTYAGNRNNFKFLQNVSNLEIIEGDICDSNLVERVIKNADAVINFAAESHVDRSIASSREFVFTNTLGVQTLLDAIMQLNEQIRFLQVSTDEVYGSIEKGSWSEESPIEPNSPYAASKAGGELLARSYRITHGLDILISRCSNNYGPLHYPEKLIPLAITNLLTGKKIPLFGDGNNSRDWLHVYDHCRALYLMLTQAKSGSVYNIGGGEELTNYHLITKILNLLELDETMIEFVPDRKGHDLRYSLDWTKIAKDLNYKPSIRFEDGIIETVSWYKKNTDWWIPLKEKLNNQ